MESSRDRTKNKQSWRPEMIARKKKSSRVKRNKKRTRERARKKRKNKVGFRLVNEQSSAKREIASELESLGKGICVEV